MTGIFQRWFAGDHVGARADARPPRHSSRPISHSSFFISHSSCVSSAAFTIFEILGVLTVIGITFMVVLGSYRNWNTVHALTGSSDILQAGLTEARTLARQNRTITAFLYGNLITNEVKTITRFQTFLCQPTNDVESVSEVESELRRIFQTRTEPVDQEEVSTVNLVAATPEHRLPGSIRMGHVYLSGKRFLSVPNESGSDIALFFRPDGSAFSANERYDERAHFLAVMTRERFKADPVEESKRLARYIRVDFATGELNEMQMFNDEVSW
ncbi:MAG: hypothetical protein J6334_08655 [Kiritimatiellae bacterium]|nr:hypothetical protein [Kiritimatiellia bacterium]